MFRKIAAVGVAAALFVPLSALAGPGAPSGYGTEGADGQRLTGPEAQSTFLRSWNASRESQNRARASADWMRTHGKGFPTPL